MNSRGEPFPTAFLPFKEGEAFWFVCYICFVSLEEALARMGELLAQTSLRQLPSLIRSQKLVRPLHLYVAYTLHQRLNFSPEQIYLEAGLPLKKVDVLVLSQAETHKVPLLAVSIRTQVASIKKNFTNNINQLQGEAIALRSHYPALPIALVYLLKAEDHTEKEDCLPYYAENLPIKLLPLIGMGGINSDRFDAALLLIRDWDKKGKLLSPRLPPSLGFIQGYEEEAFWNRLQNIVGEKAIKAPYTLADLLLNESKRKTFLGE